MPSGDLDHLERFHDGQQLRALAPKVTFLDERACVACDDVVELRGDLFYERTEEGRVRAIVEGYKGIRRDIGQDVSYERC